MRGTQLCVFVRIVQIRFADDFSVRYGNYYKVVTNLRANETYVLYQCGTPKPELTSVPDTTKYFQVPAKSVGSGQTVAIAFLEALGVTQELTFAVRPRPRAAANGSCAGCAAPYTPNACIAFHTSQFP